MAENNVLVAHFPRAAMGYSQGSVDEFVRQIGERLEEMQMRLDQVTEENENLQRQLASAPTGGEGSSQREAALANAMLAIEQRRLSVDQELEQIWEKARRESEVLKEAARRETEGFKEAAKREAESARISAQAEATQILNQAKAAAEQMIDEAASATAEEEARLQVLCAKYEGTIAEMRRLLEAQLALLPPAGPKQKAESAKADPAKAAQSKAAAPQNFSGPAFEEGYVDPHALIDELASAA